MSKLTWHWEGKNLGANKHKDKHTDKESKLNPPCFLNGKYITQIYYYYNLFVHSKMLYHFKIYLCLAKKMMAQTLKHVSLDKTSLRTTIRDAWPDWQIPILYTLNWGQVIFLLF